MSEKQLLKDVIKDLKTSLHAVDEKNDERYKELRKDLDVNVALCASTSNRVETLKAKKEDTDKLKSHQIDLTSQFNINVRNVQSKMDTIDRDYSILACKMDAFSNTLTTNLMIGSVKWKKSLKVRELIQGNKIQASLTK